MSDRTGMQRGILSPIIYFKREDGFCMLPFYEAGDPSLAHRVWQERYKNHPTEKWMWCETHNLDEVQNLQDVLIRQEEAIKSRQLENHDMARAIARKTTGDALRQRILSSATTEFDREVCKIWLETRDQKHRDRARHMIEMKNSYLWAAEMDSSSKGDDRIKSQPGEFWRTEQQQKC